MLDHVAFGALVKRKRGEKKLLSINLAEDVFGDPKRRRHLAKIENALVLPDPETVQKLCAVLEISEAEMAEIRNFRLVTQLNQIPALDRDELDLLAFHFGAERAHDQSENELRSFLTLKAQAYRSLRRRVADLAGVSARIDAVHAAIETALECGDFEAAKGLLVEARESAADAGVETLEINAKLMERQAAIALLQGKVRQAQSLLSSAAESFSSVDPQEPARRKIFRYVDILWDHGLRFGGDGLTRSKAMLRMVLTDDLKDLNSWLWAAGQNALAVVLSDQGGRLDGAPGTELIGEAVVAYRAALSVYTQAEYPVEWAMAQNNLGTALSDQGERTEDPEGAALLAEAVDAYRAALEVYTRADHPTEWAMAQNNLGAALQEQGTQTEGADGVALLEQAVEAYRAALSVRTRDDNAVGWAMTQENMAIAEQAIAMHDANPDPRPHLSAALQHVEAALGVYDSDYLPAVHDTATSLRDGIRAVLM